MSAWTAAAVADRRRDLADPSARPGDQFARAAAYVLAAQQTPPLVLVGSWVVSWLRDGVRPAHVRSALADALTAVDRPAGIVDAAFGAVEEAVGWRFPVGLVNDIMIGCAQPDEKAAVLAALAPYRPATAPED